MAGETFAVQESSTVRTMAFASRRALSAMEGMTAFQWKFGTRQIVRALPVLEGHFGVTQRKAASLPFMSAMGMEIAGTALMSWIVSSYEGNGHQNECSSHAACHTQVQTCHRI